MIFFGTLLILLCSVTASVSATITFEAQELTDSKQPNYLKFRYLTNDFDSFETLAADFNGDGFEDILSLGGATSNFGIGGVTFTIPLGMMLYQDGEFAIHDLEVNFASPVVNVIDIDKDDDLDIVTLAGYILVNDGLANFTAIDYNPGWMLGNNIFTIDWDNDGDFDIVTPKRVFINDGNLNFSSENAFPINNTHAGNIIYVADINNDTFIDFVISKGSVLQSWINNQQGQFDLQYSLDVTDYIYQIHALDADDTNNLSLLLAVRGQGQNKVLSLQNDDNGEFIASEFVLDFDSIAFDFWRVEKMYNHDMNNDGSNELLIATTFRNSSDCQNWQNLLFIYQQDDQGGWQLSDKLHAEGYQSDPNHAFSAGRLTIPSIIDLNQDSLLDIILPGDKPIVWLSGSNSSNNDNHYYVSNRSMMQFSSTIDAMNFNNHEVAADNKLDIFQAIDMLNQCTVPDIIYTPKNFIRSILWINDDNGEYYSFASNLDGGNDFLQPYKYFKFVDIENTGSPSFIATRQSQDNKTAQSFYIDPRYIEPLFSIQLPQVTYFVESANLDLTDDTQEIIMIADTADAPILVYKLNNGQFNEIARLDFGNKDGEFKLIDIDGDGHLDIIANNKQESNAIAIWYNNGQGQFTKGQSFGNNTQAIAIMDINNDGQLDIMSANATHDIWLQQAHNQFAKLNYDDSFWRAPVGATEDYSRNWIPSNMQVQDINNDGRDDLIVSIQNSRRVYINESSGSHIWFYYIYSSYTGQNVRNNVVFSDFNNDDLVDFLSTNNETVILNTQTTANPTTGLFYDLDYSGHGYSIDNIGHNNLFYTIFYSYDNNGKPQWFSSLNRYTTSSNGSESLYSANRQHAIRFSYDYVNRHAIMDNSPEYSGFFSFLKYSTQDFFARAFYKVGDTQNNWSIRPIITAAQAPANDLSGLWWAGSDDAGWGISLSFVQRESSQEVVAVVYLYDENGEPRWLLGQQNNFELGQNVTIAMQQINGYGREQNYVELTELGAGSITINLTQASQDLSQAGTLSMDVHYPTDTLNDNWIRTNIPLALFSKPKN